MIDIQDKLEKVREFIKANPGKSNRWYAYNNGFIKKTTFYKYLNNIVIDRSIDRSIDKKTDNFTDKMDKKDEYIEIWKTAIYDGIVYEGLYKVSNLGKILSLDYNHTGKPGLMNPTNVKGYLRVGLSKNGKTKKCLVHRLVAEAFLPNPEGKPCVNHKIEGDEGKKINMVIFNEDGTIDKERTTIEWCTYEENNNYATHNERVAKALSKKVLQLSLSGELFREWESTQECERNGFKQSAVAACCRGERKTHKGFRFMYYDDYKEKQFKELGCIPLF